MVKLQVTSMPSTRCCCCSAALLLCSSAALLLCCSAAAALLLQAATGGPAGPAGPQGTPVQGLCAAGEAGPGGGDGGGVGGRFLQEARLMRGRQSEGCEGQAETCTSGCGMADSGSALSRAPPAFDPGRAAIPMKLPPVAHPCRAGAAAVGAEDARRRPQPRCLPVAPRSAQLAARQGVRDVGYICAAPGRAAGSVSDAACCPAADKIQRPSTSS